MGNRSWRLGDGGNLEKAEGWMPFLGCKMHDVPFVMDEIVILYAC